MPTSTGFPAIWDGAEKAETDEASCERSNRSQGQDVKGKADAAALGAPVPLYADALVLVLVHHFTLLGRRAVGLPQKLVDGDAEDLGQLRQNGNIRAGQVVFPLADRLSADAHAFCKLFLGHAQAFAMVFDTVADGCIVPRFPLLFVPSLCQTAEKKAIICKFMTEFFQLNQRLSREKSRGFQ